MSAKKAQGKSSLGNILITGGCGFLGSNIVSQLETKYECNISVIDLRTNQNRHPNVTYFDADITSPSVIRSIFEKVKPTSIIHTASPTAVTNGSSKQKNNARRLYEKVNIEGTRTLLEEAAHVGTVKGFVYTSSASIIHDGTSDLVDADERWPVLHAPAQKEYYSETKAIAEEMVLAANRKHGKMLTVALRPSGIFGEGDQQITANMIQMMERGQNKFQIGDNVNMFDFTYVGNAAWAHILAVIALFKTSELSVEPLDHERVDGEAFLITNGEPIYFWDLPRAMHAACGSKIEPNQLWHISRESGLIIASIMELLFWLAGGFEPNLNRLKIHFSCMTRYFNINKARQRLGYKPTWTLDQAMQRIGTWYLDSKQQEAGKKDQ